MLALASGPDLMPQSVIAVSLMTPEAKPDWADVWSDDVESLLMRVLLHEAERHCDGTELAKIRLALTHQSPDMEVRIGFAEDHLHESFRECIDYVLNYALFAGENDL